MKNALKLYSLFLWLLIFSVNLNALSAVPETPFYEMSFPGQLTGSVIAQPEKGRHDSAVAWIKKSGCEIISDMPIVGLIEVYPTTMSIEQFEFRATGSGLFQMIERDVVQECFSDVIPNDPLFNYCWYIRASNTDQDIDADLAWDNIPATAITRTVAILDGHGTLGHVDLDANVVARYNAHTQTSNIDPENSNEKHINACAGIVAPVYNNGIGVPGLGKNLLKLRLVKFGYNAQSNGSFAATFADQVRAFNNAASDPTVASVSCSWGSNYSASVQVAINALISAGISVFASTGNSGLITSSQYPAAYIGVLAVSATSSSDLKSSFSNYGGVTFCGAPGNSITTTDNMGTSGYTTNDYNQSFSGTSASCPMVAAVGGLLKTVRPDAPSDSIKKWIAQGCEKVGPYNYTTSAAHPLSSWSLETGYGRLNINNSLLKALAWNGVVVPPPSAHTISVTCSASPSVIEVGQQLTISAVQSTNAPSLPQIASTIQYFYSTDPVYSSSDILIATDQTVLGTGTASGDESAMYIIPSGTGTRYILVTDAQLQLKCSSVITVGAASPPPPPPAGFVDAAISFNVAPPSITCQNSLTISVKITNTGSVAISAYKISYGWNNSLSTLTVNLPSPISPGSFRSASFQNWMIPSLGNNTFRANILTINGSQDGNLLNNSIASVCQRTTCPTGDVEVIMPDYVPDPEEMVLTMELQRTFVYSITGSLLYTLLPNERPVLAYGLYIIREEYNYGTVITEKRTSL